MMQNRHFMHRPPKLPTHLTLPETTLCHNLEVSAARYPSKPLIVYYDTQVGNAQFLAEVEALAGYLQHACGIARGERVLLYMQNSPQYMVAYYAILRANAVVVPVNPMNLTEELRHYISDSDARVSICGQELQGQLVPLLSEGKLARAIAACYADYLRASTDLELPDFVRAPAAAPEHPHVVRWSDAMSARLAPGALRIGPDDLCVLPYTSGTTGRPKGCMHTHRSVQAKIVGGALWTGMHSEAVLLASLPFFHVTGMHGSMNTPI